MSSFKPANGEKRAGFPRVIPDSNRVTFDGPPETAEGGGAHNGEGDAIGIGGDAASANAFRYEDVFDLDAIARAQIEQDLLAYRYDLDFCQSQIMVQEDISPEEVRKLQLRILDCSHSIRHCKHRLELSDARGRSHAGGPYRAGPAVGYAGRRNISAGRTRQIKKRKVDHVARGSSDAEDGVANGDGNKDANGDVGNSTLANEPDAEVEAETSHMGTANNSIVIADEDDAGPPGGSAEPLQRLGFWNCRLCQSRKYAEAGGDRVPSAPSKWPLKDIAKMINHFLGLHTEHTPSERCIELGDALARNRGPFKYWLTRTKNMSDTTPVNEFVAELRAGSLPESMRPLLPAARAFPNAKLETSGFHDV
ncbi:hypothetical protein F5Y18DRAFT_427776 [Xylariaceae sp. FL1019]|nr:hypothetical protein F5Y18DRAFT_427776 [Xylariaceae sp. FL1019]